MNRDAWHDYLSSAPIILDGATGTNLQAAGLPVGQCPERWVLDHPTVLADLQRAFYAAGSDLVYAFSFGANRIKLGHHGFAAADVLAMNRDLAAISCAVRDDVASWPGRQRQPLVAGDLAPTGEFLSPAGTLGFDELVEIYRQQVLGLLEAGVDLFVAETMLDLAQTRAAVFAVRDVCDLPVLASLTVEKNGRTLSGNSIRECVFALASCGADAVGLNCSFGPDGLGALAREVLAQSPVPILIKPNAGIPRLVDGQTRFDMDPDRFADAMADLAGAGVTLVGGCCGTRPDHIRALADRLDQSRPLMASSDWTGRSRQAIQSDYDRTICSGRQTLCIDWNQVSQWPLLVGISSDDLADTVAEAAEDEPDAIILDLSAVHPADGPAWLDALDLVQMQTPTPLVFKGNDPDLLQAVVRRYHGRTALLIDLASTDQWPAINGAIMHEAMI